MRIPLRVMLAVFLRSLFIQAAWNFKGMQNIGFSFALAPGLTHVLGENASRGIERSLSFFNTQPYMAPTIMGVYLHLYERGEETSIPKIGPSLSGSLAALGDTFFWATLKPIMALLLIVCVVTGAPWCALAVLVGYNAVHVWIMAWGFSQGYSKGMEGALAVGRAISINRTGRISLGIPFLCGVVLFLAAVRLAPPDIPGVPHVGHTPPGVLGGILFIAAFALARAGARIYWFVYGVFALSVIWTMLK